MSESKFDIKVADNTSIDYNDNEYKISDDEKYDYIATDLSSYIDAYNTYVSLDKYILDSANINKILDANNTSVSLDNYILDSVNTNKILEDYNIHALERLVYSHLIEGKTKEAKQALEEFNNFTSHQLDKWREAFSKKYDKETGKASLNKSEMKKESKWLKENSDKFASKWVAFVSGKLISSNENLEELKKEIKNLKDRNKVTFIKL